MLIVLPVLRHCLHHPRDVINFRMLPLFVDTSLPRSISDERHEEESSKLEPRRWRWKHAQFRSIVYWVSFLCLCVRWYVRENAFKMSSPIKKRHSATHKICTRYDKITICMKRACVQPLFPEFKWIWRNSLSIFYFLFLVAMFTSPIDRHLFHYFNFTFKFTQLFFPFIFDFCVTFIFLLSHFCFGSS